MRTRHKHGLVAGAAVLAVLIAAPAIGAGAYDDPGVQPSPSASAQKVTHAARVPAQPKANAPGARVTKVAPVPRQPVNRHPQKSTGSKAGLPTQVRGPKEKASPRLNRPGRNDRGGVNGADRRGGRSDR